MRRDCAPRTSRAAGSGARRARAACAGARPRPRTLPRANGFNNAGSAPQCSRAGVFGLEPAGGRRMGRYDDITPEKTRAELLRFAELIQRMDREEVLLRSSPRILKMLGELRQMLFAFEI